MVPERLSLWVAGGYSIGGLQLVPAGGTALETGIDLLAGAAGLRGTLVPEAASGGFSLGVNAEGLLLRATSEAAPRLAATTADVNRIRLGVEGAYAVALGDGARLTPSIGATANSGAAGLLSRETLAGLGGDSTDAVARQVRIPGSVQPRQQG